MYACGKYSIRMWSSIIVTATTSNWQSLQPNVRPLPLLRKAPAALIIFVCFLLSTFSCGGACMLSRRVFTSTKCIPSALMEMMSISRWPDLQFLSITVCPFSVRCLQARSSPACPSFCLLCPSPSILPPHSLLSLSFACCLRTHCLLCRIRCGCLLLCSLL